MKKYCLVDAIAAIEMETKAIPTQVEIAKALNTSQMNISRRVNNKSELKVSEVHALQEYFNCNILRHLGFNIPDAVEIKPYNNPEYEHLILNPKLKSIWNDRQLTRDEWEEDEANLRYLSMPGNNMDGGIFPITNGAPLIVDTSSTDILQAGVFAYITNAGYFVNKIKVRADGKVEFIHANPIIENREYTQEELTEMGFKVIGRMIKPMNKYRG
jgi:transcriptional regulator with XRE-family HTH domain